MIDWHGFRWPFATPHEGERLSALLDDELDVDDALRVTRHVAGCPRCLAELQAIREARDALRSLPRVSPPQELYAQLLSTPTLSPRRTLPGRRVASAVAASAALVAGAAFIAGGRDGGTVAPPVDVFVVDHVSGIGGDPLLVPVHLGR